MTYMQEQGVQSGIHYPICIEETGAYSDVGIRSHNPITKRNADRLVSLPIHPFMSNTECNKVVQVLNAWVSEKKIFSQVAI